MSASQYSITSSNFKSRISLTSHFDMEVWNFNKLLLHFDVPEKIMDNNNVLFSQKCKTAGRQPVIHRPHLFCSLLVWMIKSISTNIIQMTNLFSWVLVLLFIITMTAFLIFRVKSWAKKVFDEGNSCIKKLVWINFIIIWVAWTRR